MESFSYRDLQIACKSRGLKAGGKRESLLQRLLDDGFEPEEGAKEDIPVAEDAVATPENADVENEETVEEDKAAQDNTAAGEHSIEDLRHLLAIL